MQDTVYTRDQMREMRIIDAGPRHQLRGRLLFSQTGSKG